LDVIAAKFLPQIKKSEGRATRLGVHLEAETLLEKLLLFRKICSAVAAAHTNAKPIVHRDLKPKNILIRGDGSIAVGDFGLCLHLGEQERHTETQEAVGPRYFMAPELEDGRQDDVTPAADVYSLGKVLYFLLSGKSFAREKHREKQYDLTRSETGSPERDMQFIYEFLDKTIVEQPKERIQDGGALIAALDCVIRKTVMNAHVLDLKAKQHCLFCVEGEYRLLGQANEFRMKLICFRCGNIQDFSAEHNGWKNWWMPN
jgi:serine/threonine protein kinase